MSVHAQKLRKESAESQSVGAAAIIGDDDDDDGRAQDEDEVVDAATLRVRVAERESSESEVCSFIFLHHTMFLSPSCLVL